jgi:triacylglycerol lipase
MPITIAHRQHAALSPYNENSSMLSRFIRIILLLQILGGALLGWWLARQSGASASWLIPLMALLLPVCATLLTVVTGAIKSRAPGAHALWWRSVFQECLACLRIFLLQLPWANRAPVVKLASATPPKQPVLLVHGYLCNHRVWDAMTESLQRAGHPVLAVDLEPLFCSIDDYAPHIEQAVTELCRQTGASQVALVGHSMGGLAIRAWMRACGTGRVAQVITLGTPHAGTRIDRSPKTENGKQMLWHSDWLQKLAASESAATRSLMKIALTPQDNIVFPQREQVLEGVPVTVFDGLGHLELSLNPPVITWVLQQLEGAKR